MRNLFLASLMVIAFQLSLHAQTFSFSPEKPSPGEEVTITYATTESNLKDETAFKVIAYAFKDTEDRIYARELSSAVEGSVLKTKLMVDEDTRLLSVLFQNESGEKSDNNQGKGYFIQLYEPGKETLLPGTSLEMGKAYSSDYYKIDLERDIEKGAELFEKALAEKPELMNDMDFLTAYNSLVDKENEEKIEALRAIAIKCLDKKSTEDQIMFAHSFFSKVKDEEMADKAAELAKQQFPTGKLVQQEVVQSFFAVRDTAADLQAEIYEEYAALSANDPEDNMDDYYYEVRDGYMIIDVTNAYLKEGNWEKFEEYAARIKKTDSGYMSMLVTSLLGKELEEKPSKKALAIADNIISKAIAKTEEKMANPAEHKETYQTLAQAEQSFEQELAGHLKNKARYWYKEEEFEKALAAYNKFLELTNQEYLRPQDFDTYITYFEKVKNAEQVEAKIAEIIQDGQASGQLKEKYQKLFMENNTMETAFEKHMALLEVEANKKLRKEVEEKVLNQESPAFVLTNLEGEEVSLEGLKGKVVILDFWATWCGPCKASFPAMQKAQDKLGSKYPVAFLFINSWENGENKAEVAGKYINDNEYPFQVLMDTDNKVIGNYKVSGIPTKFIIGPDGKTRFKSVGYAGNEGKLIKELELMIQIAMEKASDPTASLDDE